MGEVRDTGRLLGSIADRSHHASLASGSFAFDEQTLRDLVKDWLALAESYRESARRARHMAMVQAPGLDFASEAQIQAVGRHGGAYLDYVTHNHDYCVRQAQIFQDALHDYLGVEHRNVLDLRDAAEAEGPGPRPGI